MANVKDLLDVLGTSSPTAPSDDYALGDTRVQTLVKYFDSIFRPKEFENEVEALYAAYQNASKTKDVTVMKQIGVDAVNLMERIKTAQAAKLDQGSFMTREYAGLPVYAWAGIGVGGLTVVGLLLKHFLGKKSSIITS